MIPATADANWQLKFWFYDTLGAQTGNTPFIVDVDQNTETLLLRKGFSHNPASIQIH